MLQNTSSELLNQSGIIRECLYIDTLGGNTHKHTHTLTHKHAHSHAHPSINIQTRTHTHTLIFTLIITPKRNTHTLRPVYNEAHKNIYNHTHCTYTLTST